MTPEEKAKEIVHKMFMCDMNCEEEAMAMLYPHALECALIAIDELIFTCKEIEKMYEIHGLANSDISYQPEQYWVEVKREIENKINKIN